MSPLYEYPYEEIASSSAAYNDRSDFSSLMRKVDTDALCDLASKAPLTLEILLRGILESTADGILALDGKGRVIQANRRCAEMWGIPKPLLDRADDQTLLEIAVAQLNDPKGYLSRVQALYGSTAENMELLRFKDGRIVKQYSAPLILDGSILGRVWTFRDITKRMRAEEGLREAEEQFRSLVEQAMTGIIIIQDLKLAYVNPRFCEIHGYLRQHELLGINPLTLIVEKDHCATMDTIRRLLDSEVDHISHNLTALRKDGATVEIGVCSSRASYRGRPAIISMLQDISEKMRIEADNRRYIDQIKIAFMSTVEVATIICEMRDPYTANHERRVADIAVAIAAELGCDKLLQEGLHIAGHLHDIGKINIPTEILSKPGKLGAIEFQLIKTHAQAGWDVLKGTEFPWPVAQVAHQHHERMDGSGYPQGLKGDEILREARIMAVADVVEAMSSHRPYRPGLGIEKALAEIEQGCGTRYDADAADACLCMFQEGRYQLPA